MGETGNQARQRQKMEVFDIIQLMPRSDVRRVAGVYSLKTGLKVETILAMIRELKDADLVLVEDGRVWPKTIADDMKKDVSPGGVEEHGDKV